MYALEEGDSKRDVVEDRKREANMKGEKLVDSGESTEERCRWFQEGTRHRPVPRQHLGSDGKP